MWKETGMIVCGSKIEPLNELHEPRGSRGEKRRPGGSDAVVFRRPYQPRNLTTIKGHHTLFADLEVPS